MTIKELIDNGYKFDSFEDLPFSVKVNKMLLGFHRHESNKPNKIIYDEEDVLKLLIEVKNEKQGL